MSNSSLVSYTKISPNKTSPRNHKIDTITIHCAVGQLSAEALAGCFESTSRKASCNYGIGTDGRIALVVEEKDRSWCSSNGDNDNRAITIECASDKTHPYAINEKVYNSLIKLCADICKRNDIKELKWKGDKSLIGQVDKQNMTVHRWFANKACPGDYIYNRLGQIASEVNALIGAQSGTNASADNNDSQTEPLYRVRRTWSDVSSQKGAYHDLENAKKNADENPGYSVFNENGVCVYAGKTANTTIEVPFKVEVGISDLNIRTGAGSNYDRTGQFTGKGVFTITEVKEGPGSDTGWGKLKSGAGWISLDFTTRI